MNIRATIPNLVAGLAVLGLGISACVKKEQTKEDPKVVQKD